MGNEVPRSEEPDGETIQIDKLIVARVAFTMSEIPVLISDLVC